MESHFCTISEQHHEMMVRKLEENQKEPMRRSRFFKHLRSAEALKSLLNVVFFTCCEIKPLYEKRKPYDLFRSFLLEVPHLRLAHHRHLRALLDSEVTNEPPSYEERSRVNYFHWPPCCFPVPFSMKEVWELFERSESSPLIHQDVRYAHELSLLSALIQLSSYPDKSEKFVHEDNWHECVTSFGTLLLKKLLVIVEKARKKQKETRGARRIKRKPNRKSSESEVSDRSFEKGESDIESSSFNDTRPSPCSVV